MIVDAAQAVGEPGFGVDIVELGGGDQSVDGGGPLAAAIGAAEGPVLAAEGNAAQLALGGVVGQADPAVIQEPRKGGLAGQHVVYRFGEGIVAR